jgi:hypothetical protein
LPPFLINYCSENDFFNSEQKIAKTDRLKNSFHQNELIRKQFGRNGSNKQIFSPAETEAMRFYGTVESHCHRAGRPKYFFNRFAKAKIFFNQVASAGKKKLVDPRWRFSNRSALEMCPLGPPSVARSNIHHASTNQNSTTPRAMCRSIPNGRTMLRASCRAMRSTRTSWRASAAVQRAAAAMRPAPARAPCAAAQAPERYGQGSRKIQQRPNL